MHSMMGIITNTKSEDLLREITQHRCMSAVPFGGRYRLIDFTLSNMVNSGIRNVGVVTSHRYRALMDHLGAGKEWGLDRKAEGMFYLPSASPSIFRKTLKFDLKDFYANHDYLEKSKQKYVLISGHNMICNIDYRKPLQFHQEKGADITVFYKEENLNPQTDFSHLTFFDMAPTGRVAAIHQYPDRLESNKVSLEMVIMERNMLLEIIRVALSSGNWDLGDLVNENIDDLRVFAYAHKGYLGKIVSVESYYKHSMDLLDPEVWKELFIGPSPIVTKVKDGPPVKYSDECQVSNAMVATGCHIKGTVEDSLLFRGVTVERGARVKNCIIMQKSEIEENVLLENVILDKETVIRKGTILKGEDGHPIIIGKKTVI